MPDFHDDFHGSALAHASLPVLEALDCTVGGCWRVRRRKWGKKREGERMRRSGRTLMEGKEEKRGGVGGREDDTPVNEHVHNAQN